MAFYNKRARKMLEEKIKTPHGFMMTKKAYVKYIPFGVVGIISPWNYPFLLLLCDAAPAIIAGNCVILKPSEFTPLTALLIQDVFQKANFPGGVYQTVTGLGRAGSILVDKVDMVAFTGSVRTGKKIAEACARQLKPVSLELGGKDPAIVLEGANLKRASKGIVWGSLFNAGQTCISIERVYVVEAIYDRFLKSVVEEVKKIKVGLDNDYNVDMGSLTTSSQLEIVENQVKDAIKKGARILVGGSRFKTTKGYFFEPTVLINVGPGMSIMEEETFGPVIAIQKVQDENEALREANRLNFGLSASIWGITKQALRLSKDMQAGSICINEALSSFLIPEIPFGGIKESGNGIRHSKHGIRRFCKVQSIVLPRFVLKREIVWYPYSKKIASLIKLFMAMFYKSHFKWEFFKGRKF